MQNSDDELAQRHHQNDLQLLERLLTPERRPLHHPLMGSASAPAVAQPQPHSHAYVDAPFVSPAALAELYGLTPSPAASELPDFDLPALALPANLSRANNARAEHAFVYVMRHEHTALEQLLALSHLEPDTSAAAKLHRALRVRGCASLCAKVERALGRWIVHEFVPNTQEYHPAAEEHSVLSRARVTGTSVYAQFRESIRMYAEAQKDALKVELDARRAALAGILNEKHAKAVNNQKSAHLSKFFAVQITQATNRLVEWLVAKCYE